MSVMSLSELGNSIDLEDVIAKASETYGWSEEDAKTAKDWYLRHLYLCKKHPDTPISALSKIADELWHQHILDTQKYATDCDKLFGRFVHHQPIYANSAGIDEEIETATVTLYQAEFGVTPPDLVFNSFVAVPTEQE